jgi:hypothetical protein
MDYRLFRTIGLFVLVGLLALLYAFVDFRQNAGISSTERMARQTLEVQGYTNIETERKYTGSNCGPGEQTYAFTAVTSQGVPARGVVCVHPDPGGYALIKFK